MKLPAVYLVCIVRGLLTNNNTVRVFTVGLDIMNQSLQCIALQV